MAGSMVQYDTIQAFVLTIIHFLIGNHCTYSVTNAKLLSPSPDQTAVLVSSIKLLNCFDRLFVFFLVKKENANDQFDCFVIAYLISGSLDEAFKFTYKLV